MKIKKFNEMKVDDMFNELVFDKESPSLTEEQRQFIKEFLNIGYKEDDYLKGLTDDEIWGIMLNGLYSDVHNLSHLQKKIKIR